MSHITRCVKKQGNVMYYEKKEKIIVTDPEMTQMLKWADKHFGAAIINMFKDFKRKEEHNDWIYRDS